MSDGLIDRLGEELHGLSTQLEIGILRRDAGLQEKGDLAGLGVYYDLLDHHRPRKSKADAMAFNFYDAWIDERNHNFVGHYGPIGKDDWPRLARYIADQLAAGAEITDPALSQFDWAQRVGCLPSVFRLFRRQR